MNHLEPLTGDILFEIDRYNPSHSTICLLNSGLQSSVYQIFESIHASFLSDENIKFFMPSDPNKSCRAIILRTAADICRISHLTSTTPIPTSTLNFQINQAILNEAIAFIKTQKLGRENRSFTFFQDKLNEACQMGDTGKVRALVLFHDHQVLDDFLLPTINWDQCLKKAAENGFDREIMHALLSIEKPLTYRWDFTNAIALHAAETGYLPLATELYEGGKQSTVNAVKGLTLAIENGHLPIIELLCKNYNFKNIEEKILLAIKKGDLSIIRFLLQIHNLNINYIDEAIKIAMQNKNKSILKMLFAYKKNCLEQSQG